MKRREFIAGSAGILAAAIAPGAMAANAWRIGQVFGGTAVTIPSAGLEQGLQDLGYVNGKNFHLLTRFVAPNPSAMKAAILDLLPDIDLLIVWGTIGGVAAKAAAVKIPVVFISVGAPVDIGLVDSLAHPGGNMTGITFEAASETYGKRLQILKEIVPGLSRAAVLGAKGDPNVPFATASLEQSAKALNVSISRFEASSTDDLKSAFDEMRRAQSEAVIVVAGALSYANGNAIADLALSNGLPSCHGFSETVVAGGLVSLGPNMLELAHQGARLVEKIISGSRPADIPVEQPTRYALSINLKTAKTLGLVVPATLLASADQVIE